MEKFIKEIALKAEDFLNSAVSQCERNTHPTTAALNAEFALGKYFALMDIVEAYDMDLYVSVATSTKEATDKLSNIVNNIYPEGGSNNMKKMVYKNRSTSEILDEGYYKQYHYAIVSFGSHPCAYVELPENNQYYGKDYDNIPIECHGGLTYSEYGLLPPEHTEHKDGYWIGWSYTHYPDYTYFSGCTYGGKIWTTEEILCEVKQVIDQLCETSN